MVWVDFGWELGGQEQKEQRTQLMAYVVLVNEHHVQKEERKEFVKKSDIDVLSLGFRKVTLITLLEGKNIPRRLI